MIHLSQLLGISLHVHRFTMNVIRTNRVRETIVSLHVGVVGSVFDRML